jgi:hypothetical protein
MLASSGESRILPYRGQVLSDGSKHALIHYFKSNLQVDERIFSAIFRKLSRSASPDNNLWIRPCLQDRKKPRTPTHHRSSNNPETAEATRSGLARRHPQKGSDDNAAIIRPPTKEQAKSSPGKLRVWRPQTMPPTG